MSPDDAHEVEAAHAGGVIWHVLGPALFKEEPLQALIEERPALLPFVDEGPVAVAAEFKVPKGGRADVVVVDANGRITIVETKLGTNSDFRGVLSQILSYAGGLYGLDYDRFKDRFTTARRTTGLTAPFEAGSDAWNEGSFRLAVADHLEVGSFHLIIAVDVVTEPLAQAVELLDARTPEDFRFSVLVCGETARPMRHVPRPADKTPEALVAGIRRRDRRAGEVAEALLAWVRDHDLEMDCSNGKDGVVKSPRGVTLFKIVGHEEQVRISLHRLRANGMDEASIQRLAKELSTLGFEANERRSKASLAALAQADRAHAFTALIEGLVS